MLYFHKVRMMCNCLFPSQYLSDHVHYHLRATQSTNMSEEDSQLVHSYNECLQLQLQLNLAHRAIYRLQTSLGIRKVDALPSPGSEDTEKLLVEAATDKLRVIMESLLDTLLAFTGGSPAIPTPPQSLYAALTPAAAQDIFEHLCLYGSQRIQVRS